VTDERKRLATVVGAGVAAVLLLVGVGFGIMALVGGGDGDDAAGDKGIQLGAGREGEDPAVDPAGEVQELTDDALDECEQFLCDDDGNVVIGPDGNPVRLGPDGRPILVDSHGNPFRLDGSIVGRPPRTDGPDRSDWPSDEELAALRQAYVDAFTAACNEIWSISPTGVLDDPYDEQLYTVDDCLDEMDAEWGELADDIAEAREMGREDALEAAYWLSIDGRLCYRSTCWEHPDYGF
jgi:hypothetical protein